jgi:choline dehydrogenase-like flavoprotein
LKNREDLNILQITNKICSVEELNGGNNTGAKQEPLTMNTKFQRSSSYDNYYQQAKGSSNLKVLTFSPVQQLILTESTEGVTTTGVVYVDYASGQTLNATANKEVIMSAGSIQTPQLLMLSVSEQLSEKYHLNAK